MSENKRNIIGIEGIITLIGAISMCITFIYVFSVIFIVSGLNGNISIYINNFGEGIPEIIIFIVYLIICIDFIRRVSKDDNGK